MTSPTPEAGEAAPLTARPKLLEAHLIAAFTVLRGYAPNASEDALQDFGLFRSGAVYAWNAALSQQSQPAPQGEVRMPLDEDKLKRLWLFRTNIHNGEMLPQLYDFARAIEEAHGIRLSGEKGGGAWLTATRLLNFGES